MNQQKYPIHSAIKSFVLLGLLCSSFIVATANAQEAEATAKKSNQVTLAIEGYDPVAYFLEAKAVKGKRIHPYVLDGKKWLFSSRANKMKFVKSPNQYKPSFDGCCPFALSEGKVMKGNPSVFSVREGKLFLFHSEEKRKRYEGDLVRRSELSKDNYIKVFSTKF